MADLTILCWTALIVVAVWVTLDALDKDDFNTPSRPNCPSHQS